MELRVLRYFLMAAREENMTKAAEILHVTQPTLSRQIMQLEEELGCKLFRRSNHSIYLTEEGMNVSLMPYSSLAAGHLTRPSWKSNSLRGSTDHRGNETAVSE